jgi:hypothetical protein
MGANKMHNKNLLLVLVFLFYITFAIRACKYHEILKASKLAREYHGDLTYTSSKSSNILVLTHAKKALAALKSIGPVADPPFANILSSHENTNNILSKRQENLKKKQTLFNDLTSASKAIEAARNTLAQIQNVNFLESLE